MSVFGLLGPAKRNMGGGRPIASGRRPHMRSWLFLFGGSNPPGIDVLRRVPPLSGSRANRPNWRFAKVPMRPPGGFPPVLSLGMDKTGLIFNLHPLGVEAYSMLFGPPGPPKRVWGWWPIDNVFSRKFESPGPP